MGKVGYLTISEGLVKKGKTQRTPGLHIERPGYLKKGGNYTSKYVDIGWGSGSYRRAYPIQGIYMCSNVSDSCAVYKASIKNPSEIVGKLGSIEHLREFLDPPDFMKSSEIWWITDKTPHEAKAMKTDLNRQFFRLVTSEVSVWYSKYSTPNPLGIKPTGLIIDDDKFEEE